MIPSFRMPLRGISLGKILSILGLFLFLYGLGVLVRGRFGIAVSVRNISGKTLQHARLTLKPHGEEYELGLLGDQREVRIFFRPRTESHIALTIMGATGPRVETVVGYVEAGYCGKAEVEILPGEMVKSVERIDPIWCKRSWFDFF